MWPHWRWQKEALCPVYWDSSWLVLCFFPFYEKNFSLWLMWIQWSYLSASEPPDHAKSGLGARHGFIQLFGVLQLCFIHRSDVRGAQTDPHGLPVKIPKLCSVQTRATGTVTPPKTIKIHSKSVLLAQFAPRIILTYPLPPPSTHFKPFPRICRRSGNCPRQRGSGSKKKRRCWKRCSTPISCDFTTFGSHRWRGRSASFWLRSSWPQGRWKRGSIYNTGSLSTFNLWLLDPLVAFRINHSGWCQYSKSNVRLW